ncbi:enoyl-CoA hydratase [Halalkalibacillus halophilus]|uniref:enoyl-CoA hydratase n=1 Tax=Halalkalibacillus halophilus TaxID=392827 RepID=UPI0003FBBE4F|nr:enoyl-CoA hydratase [Halalkalibacillus halophilus]
METVQLKLEERVATITLNRPGQLNAMNIELLTSLNNALEEVEKSSADIVVITGAGKAFSAGGDMKMMLQEADAQQFSQVMDMIESISLKFYSLPKITIAALNGAAAGLGLSLALGADYVIADQNARAAMNFIGIGLVPDGGGHFHMEQRLGAVKAKQLIWQGEMLNAEQAYEVGLIDQYTTNEFSQLVEETVGHILKAPTKSMIETKEIIQKKHYNTLAETLKSEKISQQKMRETKDHQEGVDAFLNKRHPEFKGE